MKKTAKLLAILTALCTIFTCFGAAPVAATETTEPINLVTNGSFEDGLTGWTNFGSGGVSAAQNTSRPAQDGSHFLYISNVSKGVYQTVNNIVGGKEYLFSMWVRPRYGETIGNSAAFATITFSAAEGKSLNEAESGLQFDTLSKLTYYFREKSDTLIEFKTVFTAPADAASAELLIRTGNATHFSGYFEADSIVIREVTDADNHVFNGDFDSVGTKGHEKYQEWRTDSTNAVPERYGIVSPAEGSGDTSDYMEVLSGTTVTGSGNYQGYGNIGTQIGIEGGRVYKFSFSAKAPAGEQQYGFLLRQRNATTSNLSTDSPIFDVEAGEAGVWRNHTIYIVAKEDATAILLQLFVNSASTTVCFDNVSLTMVSESAVYFTDASEVVQTEPDKVTRAIAFYVPETAGESTVPLMVAIYKTTENGTTLNSLSITDVTSTAGEAVSKNVSMELPADTAMETYHARVFLWDEIGLLMPLAVTEQLGGGAE